jgi:hypothetical protein
VNKFPNFRSVGVTATIVFCGEASGDKAGMVDNSICGNGKTIAEVRDLSVKITESVATIQSKLTWYNHWSTVSCFPLIPL